MAGYLLAGAGLGALGAGVGGYMQYRAAQDASRRAERAGQQGMGILQGSFDQSMQDLQGGFSQGQNYYANADALLAGGQQQLGDIYAQERQTGANALQRINDVVLGGDMSALQMDPGYAFRMAEGNKAIERAAAAAGSFGSGANLMDFANYSQGLASQEYNNSINRLMGLAGIGQAANQNYAAGTQGYIGSRANVAGNQAGLAAQGGLAASNLRQQNAAAQANALNNQASTVNGYQLQGQNAISNAIGGVTNAGQSVLTTLALQDMYSRPQAPTYSGINTSRTTLY